LLDDDVLGLNEYSGTAGVPGPNEYERVYELVTDRIFRNLHKDYEKDESGRITTTVDPQ
jgi:hypothetical protein